MFELSSPFTPFLHACLDAVAPERCTHMCVMCISWKCERELCVYYLYVTLKNGLSLCVFLLCGVFHRWLKYCKITFYLCEEKGSFIYHPPLLSFSPPSVLVNVLRKALGFFFYPPSLECYFSRYILCIASYHVMLLFSLATCFVFTGEALKLLLISTF